MPGVATWPGRGNGNGGGRGCGWNPAGGVASVPRGNGGNAVVGASALGGVGSGSSLCDGAFVIRVLLGGIAFSAGLLVGRECVSPVLDDDAAPVNVWVVGVVGGAEDVVLLMVSGSWSGAWLPSSSGSASGWGSSGSSTIGGRPQGEVGLGRASSEGDGCWGGVC